MQGTLHNVENVPPEKDDELRSKETEKDGGTPGAPEAPTGPASEGTRNTESGTDKEGSES